MKRLFQNLDLENILIYNLVEILKISLFKTGKKSWKPLWTPQWRYWSYTVSWSTCIPLIMPLAHCVKVETWYRKWYGFSKKDLENILIRLLQNPELQNPGRKKFQHVRLDLNSTDRRRNRWVDIWTYWNRSWKRQG